MKTQLKKAVDFARNMITPRAIDNIECNVGDKLTIDIILESPVGILGYQFYVVLSPFLQFDSYVFANAFGSIATTKAMNFIYPNWFVTETLTEKIQFQPKPFRAMVIQINCTAVSAGIGIGTLTDVKVVTVKNQQNIEMANEIEYNQAIITALADVEVCKITVKIKKA